MFMLPRETIPLVPIVSDIHPLPGGRIPYANPRPDLEHSKTKYGKGLEAQQVRLELAGFDYQSSRAWRHVKHHFGASIRLRELKGIVTSIILFIKMKHGIDLPRLSRNAKRCVPLLVKYIDEHHDYFLPLFHHVNLEGADKKVIPLLDSERSLSELQQNVAPANSETGDSFHEFARSTE
jgi:hypothetical protein